MRRLTIERTATIVLFLLLFALATRTPVDTDIWWHLRSGEHTLAHGMIHTDPFSWTKAGEPWVNHSWGSQVLLYAVWSLGGNAGLALFTALLATAGMAVLFRISAGNAYLRGVAVVLGAAAAAVFWSPRPQMLSFFFSAVIIFLLYTYKRRGIDRLWLIPPVMALWGNLHAGFSIGFIFLLGGIAGETLGRLFGGEHALPWSGIRKLVLVTLVSALALLLNPYGLEILAVPFQTVSIGALQDYIQEWSSPDFHQRQTWPFVALMIALYGAAGASGRRLDWTDFLLTSGTAFMALLAGRNIAVFAVVATPVLTYYLDASLEERGWTVHTMRFVSPLQVRINVAIIALVAIGAAAKIAVALNPSLIAEAQAAVLPVEAARSLEGQSGPMFNSYNWGGYLMFSLPQLPVYVDGRTDLYGDAFLTEYLKTATAGDGWRARLAEQGVRLVIVEAASGLGRALRDEPGWSLLYQDDLAVVFVREEAA